MAPRVVPKPVAGGGGGVLPSMTYVEVGQDTGTGSGTSGSAAAVPVRVRVHLPSGGLTVRKGAFRLRASCSSPGSAEIAVVAEPDTIARKRFSCEPPGRTVRVRLNERGRKLLARDGRIRAQLHVLSGGRTIVHDALLVSPQG